MVFEHQDQREDHRGRPDDRRPDQHRLGGGFERVAGPVVVLEQELSFFKIRGEPEVALDLLFDARSLLDHGKLEDRLRVVRNRAVAVHGDRHGTHAEHPEGHEAEGEDRRIGHEMPDSRDVGGIAVGIEGSTP